MNTATLRLPVRSAQVQARPYPTHGAEVLASIRLDLLADALRSMEHDDTDPGEKRMNADQCRDALLRELLGGWTWSELVLSCIPAVVEMQEAYSEIRRKLAKADAELYKLRPLAMLAAHANTPILDQAIEKVRAQANEIAALRRERDEARAALPPQPIVRDNFKDMISDMVTTGNSWVRIPIPTPNATPTPGAQE